MNPEKSIYGQLIIIFIFHSSTLISVHSLTSSCLFSRSLINFEIAGTALDEDSEIGSGWWMDTQDRSFALG